MSLKIFEWIIWIIILLIFSLFMEYLNNLFYSSKFIKQNILIYFNQIFLHLEKLLPFLFKIKKNNIKKKNSNEVKTNSNEGNSELKEKKMKFFQNKYFFLLFILFFSYYLTNFSSFNSIFLNYIQFLNSFNSLKTPNSKKIIRTPVDTKILDNKIQSNKEYLNQFEIALPWMELGLNNVHFYNHLQEKYDNFFDNMINDDCQSFPSEILKTYYMTIHKNNLNSFLNENFIKDLPEKVQNQLALLKYNKRKLTTSDTFAKIHTINSHEAFEIGHMMFHSIYDNDTNEFHILLLVPSIKTTLQNNCYFNDDWRKRFIGASQEIQNLLAIKAAENRAFIDSLEAYSRISRLKREECDIIPTETGSVCQKSLPMID